MAAAEIINLLEGLGLCENASDDDRQLLVRFCGVRTSIHTDVATQVEQLQNQLDSDNYGKVSLEDFAATIEGVSWVGADHMRMASCDAHVLRRPWAELSRV